MTFYVLAALILVFAVLVVTAKSTVHGILFLVADFLAVALLYAALNSLFVAAIQVLVYAGGIVVLYLFVVMLVRRGPEAARVPERQNALGVFLAGAVLVELASLGVWAALRPAPASGSTGNPGTIEAIGTALYGDYLIPFEVASMLLLVAMVGAILLARREL
jgi:NADH-quinone oxidoreductase subunit J